MVWIGVDPGLSGAVAFIPEAGEARVFSTPTLYVSTGKSQRRHYHLAEMYRLFDQYSDESVKLVTLEIQQAFPGQGVTSTFSIGYGYGLWHMFFSLKGWPLELARPAKWKKEFGLSSDKGRSLLRANELFPHLSAEIRVKDDAGRAEALLLAEYARRKRP